MAISSHVLAVAVALRSKIDIEAAVGGPAELYGKQCHERQPLVRPAGNAQVQAVAAAMAGCYPIPVRHILWFSKAAILGTVACNAVGSILFVLVVLLVQKYQLAGVGNIRIAISSKHSQCRALAAIPCLAS